MHTPNTEINKLEMTATVLNIILVLKIKQNNTDAAMPRTCATIVPADSLGLPMLSVIVAVNSFA